MPVASGAGALMSRYQAVVSRYKAVRHAEVGQRVFSCLLLCPVLPVAASLHTHCGCSTEPGDAQGRVCALACAMGLINGPTMGCWA
jgi:hypothetical protein